MDFKHKKIYYIDSNNRISGTAENMQYKIDMKNLDPDHCVVLSANIPKTYYILQDGYNKFSILENGVTTIITMTPGNYSRKTLKNELQTILNASSSQGWSYSISYASISQVDDGKYSFSVSGNGVLQPSFIFTNVESHIHEMMGFDKSSTNAFVSNSLKSVNVIKIIGEDTLYIKTDFCSGHAINTLQEIYSHNEPDYNNIRYMNSSPLFHAKEINNQGSSVFHFQITNENNTIMNLNGCNWTMTLCVFFKETVFDELKNYIQTKKFNVNSIKY